jgi:hypothetical protein
MSSLTYASAVPSTRQEHLLLATLEAGIPISLLMDLATPDPHSRELFDQEHADLSWAS